MRARLFFGMLLATAPALAQTPFCDQLRALTQDPTVAAAHWGLSVTTLAGTPLCQINDAQLFRPASNAKLFTTAAALALLGPGYTVRTNVVAESRKALALDATELDGNLRLIGAGDANLSTRPIPYTIPKGPARPDPLEQLADQIAATGLRHVTGRVIGEDTLWPAEPYPSDWAVGDLLGGDGAPVSALTVYDNQLRLSVTAGLKPGSPATLVLLPAGTHFAVSNSVTTVAAKAHAAVGLNHFDDDRSPQGIRVFGTVAIGAPYVTDVAIPNAPLFAAGALQDLLESRGVRFDKIPGAVTRLNDDPESLRDQVAKPLPSLRAATLASPVPTTCALGFCEIVASHTSPTLLEDVVVTLKVSENLHAELLLHQVALAFGDQALQARGSSAQGARVVRQWLLNAGINKDEFVFTDGSGLSTHDLITPRAATALLAYAATQPWFAGYKAALPLGGVDGTLTNRFTTTLKGKVQAKTGTLGESRALSGFVDTALGQTLIFSILVDTHLPGSTADRKIMDQMVELIAAQN